MAASCSCKPGTHPVKLQALTQTSQRGCFDFYRLCLRSSFSVFSPQLAQQQPCKVILLRLIKEEDPSEGVVIGKATLPDLEQEPTRSAKDLRALLSRLVYQTAFGGLPVDDILRQETVWEAASTPVWWPMGLRFQDPAIGSVSKRQLKEAVVRCFWLFQEADKLTDPLHDLAVSMMMSKGIPEGELPLNPRVHRAFYDNYVVDTGEEID